MVLLCSCKSQVRKYKINFRDQRLLYRLINQRDGTKFSKKIGHLFNSEDNDWGFSYYMSWQDVMDPEKGYINVIKSSDF